MTPALSQSGNARDGIVPDSATTAGDARETARPAWPALPKQGPVRVYTTGVRLLRLEPTKDTRPHVLTAWIGDLIGALR